MTRGRLAALIVGGCLALVAVVAVLAGAGGDGGGSTTRAPAVQANPLAFAPPGAELVADLDLRVPLVGLAFGQLLSRGLGPASVDASFAGHALLVQDAGRGLLAWQVDTGDAAAVADRLRGAVTARGGAVGAQDGVVVVAADQATLAASLRRARSTAGRGAAAAFDRRLARLPRRSGARVAFAPRALLARIEPGAAATRWVQGLRDGVAEVSVDNGTAVVSFRLTGAAALADLPIAPGATAPPLRGSAPVVAALRDPGRTLDFARAAGLLSGLSVLDRLPGFLKPDLHDLGPDGTLTSSDRHTATLRLTPPDPGDWSKKLRRLDALSGLARALGIADVRIDRHGAIFRIEQHGAFAARVGVFGRVVVLSTSQTADLRAAAAARTKAAPPGSAGAVALRIAPTVIYDVLDRALGTSIPRGFVRLGALTGWARAEPNVVAGELRLPVAI